MNEKYIVVIVDVVNKYQQTLVPVRIVFSLKDFIENKKNPFEIMLVKLKTCCKLLNHTVSLSVGMKCQLQNYIVGLVNNIGLWTPVPEHCSYIVYVMENTRLP